MAASIEVTNGAGPATQRVRNLEVEIHSIEMRLEELGAVIQNHRTERPAVAELLPDDELVRAWKQQGEQLDRLNRELRRQLAECREQMKLTRIDESEEIKQKLAAICIEREGLEVEFERKQKKIYRVRELRVVHQAEVDRISEQIRESAAAKPPSADYVPESPKAKAWQKNHDSLLRQLQEAINRREESRRGCPDTLEVLKIAQRIDYLKHAERNLLDRLGGSEPGPRGGVTFVG